MAQTFETIMSYPAADRELAKKAIDDAIRIIQGDLSIFTSKFPSSNSFGGFYEATENVEWTTGFWTGSIWLAYEYTKDDALKKAAEVQVDSFFERIRDKIDVNHHDMGFLFSLSCVAAYKLTGNSAADVLLGEKLALAEADGIAAEVSLVLPDTWGIDDFDLCVIFANALDNAVNACKAFNGEKSIHISGARQGDFYMLEFKNTCPEDSFPDGFPPAGTGLSNIRTVAEKYHGAMLAEKSKAQFTLNVLLDISLHPEDISAQRT